MNAGGKREEGVSRCVIVAGMWLMLCSLRVLVGVWYSSGVNSRSFEIGDVIYLICVSPTSTIDV